MQSVPEIYQAVLQHIIRTSRACMEEMNAELPPMMMLGSIKRNTVEVFPMSYKNNKEKDVAANVTKAIAGIMQADFIIHVSEAYSLNQVGTKEDVAEIMKKYKSISDHPDAIESMIFSLETPYGIWTAYPPIKVVDGKRTFDEPHFTKMDGAAGRFTHLLPQLQDSDYQPLH